MGMHKLLIAIFKIASLFGVSILSTYAASPICCFPKQFESLMFAVNTGAGDSNSRTGDSFGWANGTIRTAYDAVNQRTYIFTKYTQASSDEPGTLDVNVTIVQDYKKNVRFQVFMGILCEEGPINDNLFVECIPEDAEIFGQGPLGDSSSQVVSYLLNVTLQSMDYQMVVSVIHTDEVFGECVPVRMSLTDNPPDKDGAIIVADVVDITRGIKDASIFNKPPNCDNDTRNAFDSTLKGFK